MKFRILSDLHAEFFLSSNLKKNKRMLEAILPPLDSDSSSTLLLAGDIAPFDKFCFKTAIKYFCNRFLHVIMVAGNHDYWYNSYFGNHSPLEANMMEFGNFYLLENSEIVIDNISIIGSTLWTDLSNPLDAFVVQQGMNDYKYMKNVTSNDTHSKFIETSKYLNYKLKHTYNPTIVLTHHNPTYKMVDNQYKYDGLNCAYFSNLDNLIEEYEPEYWICGHSHTSKILEHFNTKIIRNPYGYRHHSVNSEFDRTLTIEL